MIQRTCVICNRLGLHARAASKLVQVAQEFGGTVTLRLDDKEANAKSIMSVMMLQASNGTEILLETDGPEEAEAADAIEALIRDRFGEDE